MEIRFKDKNLEKICNDPAYAMRNCPVGVVPKIQELMYHLNALEKFNMFYRVPALRKYNAHPLKGDKKGIISLYLGYHYRMEVIVSEFQIDIVKIMEVTNHYGD